MKKTTDPIGCIPSAASVEQALEHARCRVKTLEFLLEVSRGVEARLNGEPLAKEAARMYSASGSVAEK